jgi:hypothetical protein
MGKFSKFMQTLNEKETPNEVGGKVLDEPKPKASHDIKLNGTEYEVVIMDSTHLKFRIKGKENWAIPQHFNQVSDDMMAELKKQGLVNGNFFKV